MGYEYSLTNLNRPRGQGQFINISRTPSKQWGVCDNKWVSDINIPQSLDPICAKFGFWSIGKPIWGKWPWQCTTTGLNNSTELGMEKIRQTVRDMDSTGLAAAPPARTMTTISLQLIGLMRGKNNNISTVFCWPKNCVPHWRPSCTFVHLPEFVFWDTSKYPASETLKNFNNNLYYHIF